MSNLTGPFHTARGAEGLPLSNLLDILYIREHPGMKGRSIVLLALVGLLALAGRGSADLITVQYTALVKTVSGPTLGLNPALDTPVSGSFTYNTATPDSLPADPVRGRYLHTAGGGFTMQILGTTITGSEIPLVQVNNNLAGAVDEFRFNDGPDALGGTSGVMSVNGVLNSNARVSLVMVDSSQTAFSSDALPLAFPTQLQSSPHTFAISDLATGNVILLQFGTLTQAPTAVPAPSGLALCLPVLAFGWCWLRRRAKGK